MEFNNFTDELLKDYTDETTEPVTEAASDIEDYYDLFDENAPAALYAAREIVYSLVDDAETAKKLSEWGEDLELDEQVALDSLIANALEGANEHEAVRDYINNTGLPVYMADKVDANAKAIVDKLLADPKTNKYDVLFAAINMLVLDGYLY